ncbi:MAG TPA: TetR/AcrR family transcriptional regulator [Actinomycetales bacterium]|jgi:AcrR family transcriptional regulator
MTGPVKGRRVYDASRRRKQAAESRAAVLDAARLMLLADGYARTSIPAVAAAAGVSPEFVYKNVGRKPALLAAVLDVAVGGDDAPVAMAQRAAITQLRELSAPRDVLEGYLDVMVQVQVRVAPLLMLAAQSADPDAAGLTAKADAERLAGMTGLAHHLHRLGGLLPGLAVDRTRDLLWTCTAPQLYDLLVTRRGWSLEDYRRHVRDVLVHVLLPSVEVSEQRRST